MVRPRAATVDEYVAQMPFPFRGHAHVLIDLVRATEPDAVERIKRGVPTWAVAGSDFCYLTYGPGKGRGAAPKVSLGFHRGTSLPDPGQHLVRITRQAKAARHVVVPLDAPVPEAALRALVRAAAAGARDG